MDRRSNALWIGPTLLVALACSQGGEQVSMASADVEAINQVRELEAATLSSEAIEGLGAVYTNDVRFMPPNEPALMGLQASESWAADFVDEFAGVSLEYTGSDVTLAGDWAIERYVGTVMMTPKAGGETITETIKGIHIYRRQPDGSWRIAQDIWNSNEAPPAGE